MYKLVVGQKLIIVPDDERFRSIREVTVTKVGRKWATIGNDRVSLETLYLDGRGYASPGRCWLSAAEYEAHEARGAAWQKLCERMRRMWSAPDNLTTERINQAAAILFGP